MRPGDKVTVKERIPSYVDPDIFLEPGVEATIAQTLQAKRKGAITYCLDFRVPGKILPGGSQTFRGTTKYANLVAV